MIKDEDYYRIREILSAFDGVDVHPKRGAKFFYPIYMTDSLEATGIDELELSVRAYNSLRRANINTIGELCYRIHNGGSLYTIRNCGQTSVIEIMDKLFAYHFARLRPERRAKYLADVVEMNMRKRE